MITKMLEELKEVDAETSFDIEKRTLFLGIHPERDLIRKAIIQITIQRAIEKRGWAYQISLTFQGTSFGKIITKDEDGSVRYHPDQASDSPAEALLQAYLAAMRVKT